MYLLFEDLLFEAYIQLNFKIKTRTSDLKNPKYIGNWFNHTQNTSISIKIKFNEISKIKDFYCHLKMKE